MHFIIRRGIQSAALFFVLTFLISNCSSSDLGRETPDRVPVDLALAGWESGAGAVISMKCANCHTSDRNAFVPANTPRVLDGINKKEFFSNPANIGLVRAMRKRVEAENTPQQMPPKFATPLIADEQLAVLNFLKSIELQSVDVTGNPDCKPQGIAKALLAQNLLLNHGNDDGDDNGGDDPTPPLTPTPQPQPAPTNPSAAEPSVTNPCLPNGNGNGTPNEQIGGNPSVTIPVPASFEEIQSIVVATCAKGGCHTGGQGDEFALKTESDFLRVKATALLEIKSGGMPRDNPTWRNTDDGKRVIL